MDIIKNMFVYLKNTLMNFSRKTYYVLITAMAVFFMIFYIKDFAFASNWWDNNNFVNDSFWRQWPTNTQIKEALFGNIWDIRTAYTQERTGNNCATWNISIVNVQNYAVSGINSLPQTLAANTIYVLSSWTYITSGQINYNGNCTAVIWKWNVKMYSSIALNGASSVSAMFKSNGKNNIILSDIKIDWLQDWFGSYRYNWDVSSGNWYWIYFYNMKNGTINAISSSNNRYWLQIQTTESVVVSNSLMYNNWVYGIELLSNTSPNYFVNNQVFDNKSVWFYMGNSTWQIISNSQFYNNTFQWIILSNANNSVISNCMSYNNNRYWLRLQSNSSNNIINNSRFYNNSNTGVFIESWLNNKYYGNIKLFNNSNTAVANTLVWWISAWSSGDSIISWLWRSDGTTTTWLSIWYNYITNPRTNDGRDLISWSSRSSTNRWNKTRTWIEFISFTYGTWLIKQARSISYDMNSLSLSNISYDTNKYIAQINFTNTNPDQFSFAAITWASINTAYTSNTVTLTWMDIWTWEYVNLNWRWTLFKNWINIWTSGTWSNGDQFTIQITSSSNNYTLRSWSMIVWTTTADFTITTLEQVIDSTPDSFSFNNIINANLNTIYTSNIVTLTWTDIWVEVNISIAWRWNIFKNWINIWTSWTGSNGDQFYFQTTSSNNYNTLRSGSMSANTISSSFAITTKIDTSSPSFVWVTSWTTYGEPLNITFSDDNLSGATLNGNPYINWTTISAEWDYIFEVSDTAWNITWATFRISIPKTITITFDANISTWIVNKAPIKYNKDVAYSFTYDDWISDGYQPVFKYLEWWQVSGENTNFVSPWLYYTDGAGNDIAFKWWYAWYSLNATFGDKHVNTPSSMTRSQLAETYTNWRDILNHSLRHITNPATGTIYNYPDNPPGTTWIDYEYEIRKNDEYVRDHIWLSGVHLTHFVTPSWDTDYIQPARDLWYKSLAHQSYTGWTNGLDIYNYANLYHLKMYRKYVTSQNSDLSNITNDIDNLIISWSNPTIKLWRQASTHVVVFTWDNTGWMDFSLWKYLVDSISNNYGKSWTDKIRVAGPQEVYEYVATKQWTNVNTIISWNQLIINLDTLDVPNDLRRESLSLLITWTNANISSISYQNWAFTYHSENKNNWLINVEMWDYYLTDRNPDAFDLWSKTGANRWQLYTWNNITLTWMSPGLNNIIYLSGAGTLYKNWSNIWTSGTGSNGDQFYVTLTASNNALESVSTRVNIWLQSQVYSITTTNETNAIPNIFSFIDKTWTNINTLYTSNIIILTWMSAWLSTWISINAGYMIKNGTNIGQSWTGWNGDQFILALTSSNNYSTTVNSTMTIAGISDIFSITTQTNPPVQGFSWNNDNFINDSFWRSFPTDTQIKEAIFGNTWDIRTAYTQERTGNNCATWNISIVNVQNYAVIWINSLTQTLAANTIYVLNSWTYITDNQIIYNWSCTAVIGKWNVKIYSSVVINSWTNTSMFKASSKNNIILSDIKIDGLSDWLWNNRFAGNPSSGNWYWVYFYNMRNGSINWVSSSNNRVWAQVEIAEDVVISNSMFYNNGVYGIEMVNNTKPNYITNSQIFNNNSVWLYITNSTWDMISNSQFYNNAFQWIVLSSVKSSVISNCMSYNNSRYWLRFQNNSSNNIINNSWFYNNNNTWVFVESWIGNTYYGNIKLFNNSNTTSANTLVWWISAWSSWDTLVSWLWRIDGSTTTWLSIWYNYITNPRTNDGRDLISWSSRSSTNRWRKNWTWIDFVSFTYGTWIIKQTRAITHWISNYTLSNLYYDANKYIAQIDYTNTNPDQFAFTNITWVSLNTAYTSNIITLAWMDAWTWEYVNLNGRWTIYKNWVSVWTSGTGSNGDQFTIQITSSSNYNTLKSGSLVIGTTSADFAVTTVEQVIDNIPDNFSFSNITGADLNTPYTSNIITLSWMEDAAEINISISWQWNILKNWINKWTSSTGSNGDQFYIQMTSSNIYNKTLTWTFLANVVSSTFSISTKPDLIFPTFSWAISWTTYNEPVSITFSDDNLLGATLNWNPYINWTTISAEWDYIFEVSDTAWNITWATFRISIPKTITITFDTNISTWIVSKAAVKYNKDVAYGMVFDDWLDDGYQPAFKYLAWWQISWWNTNFIAPWLYYTDGAGNDIWFRWWYAWYSVNSNFTDLHINTPSYITWTQLKETYLDWWDVINHWRTSSAYPSVGQTFAYPDNPPGTTWLDYAYEIQKAYEYVRDHIWVSWVLMSHFILPSWDPAYTQPARDQWYKSVSSQWINNWSNWINIYNNLDLYHLQMHRQYVTSQNSDLSNVMNDINTLMNNSSGANTKLWRHAFTHWVVFTGNNNGWIDFTLWKYLMDNMASTYGKNWTDKIWFAGPQEVYEYVSTKQWTNISTTISWNQLIINLDTLNVPSDLRRKALSLLITWTNAHISSIAYQNWAFTYHTENKNNWLINLEMWDYYLNDRNPDSFNLWSENWANKSQSYNTNTIILTWMSPGLNNIIYLSGAWTIYKNGTNKWTSSTGSNGDQFYIQMTSSNNGWETISTTLKIWLQSTTYSITTQADAQVEDDVIDLPSSNTKSTMDDRLIASWYNNGTGSIKANLNTFLVWTKKIRTRDSAGKILAAIIMQSSGANNKIEAQIPAWTTVKKANNNIYTWIINTPQSIPVNNISLQNAIYAASFGSTWESINFEDTDNMPANVTVRLPAPWKNLGDSVDIYYSEDNWSTWNFHTSTIVTLINWEPYVEFDTTHFTDFAITLPWGSFTWTFVINNDAISTTLSSVTLNNSTTPNASKMRFADTIGGLSNASRENYATTKSWTLPWTTWTKIVYAQFDLEWDWTSDVQISDIIEYIDWGGGWGWSCIPTAWTVSLSAGGWGNIGCLTLDINPWSLSCTYENNLYVWSGASSYLQHDVENTFTGYFECIDLNWTLTSWNLTTQSSTLINQANNSKTITTNLIYFKSAPTNIQWWSCLKELWTTTYVDSTQPRIIMGKLNDQWAICTLQTTGNMIKISIPANQAVGNYLSTISYTLNETS